MGVWQFSTGELLTGALVKGPARFPNEAIAKNAIITLQPIKLPHSALLKLLSLNFENTKNAN